MKMEKKMWVWAEETQINPKEWKKILLLATDDDGYTMWHRVAGRRNLEALETLWCWAKEVVLNTDELMLAQTRSGYTAFQLPEDHVETLNKLWVWAEEMQINPKS